MLLKIDIVLTLIALISGTYSAGQKHLSDAKDSCVPSNVPYFLTTWFNDSINLEWTAPETCVQSFLVYLNDDAIEVPYNSSVENYYYSFNELEACTDYTTTVVVVGEDGTTSERIDLHYLTLVPSKPGIVSDVSIEASDDSWELSWNPPKLQKNCISYYNMYIKAYDGKSVTEKQSNTSYVFTPLIPCMSYTIEITAYIGTMPGNKVTSKEAFPARVPRPPLLVGVEVHDTSATVTLSLDQPFAPDLCRVKYITIQCTINGFLGFSFTQPYEGTTSNPDAVVDIIALAPNATYMCQTTAENAEGTSAPSAPFMFVTN